MSDIKKLHEVINSLEEQSSRVSEFNGVLSAINSSKSEISLAKTEFEELAQEHKKTVAENCIRFDEFGDRLNALEQKLSTIESEMLTESQYDVGRDKILLRMSELRFVSTEHFDNGINKTEKAIISLHNQSYLKLEGLILNQEKSISYLRVFLILSVVLSMTAVILKLKDLFF